jgi:ribulose-5-phosphate 4-epimerase/fuculose-1-phosphate aldolase
LIEESNISTNSIKSKGLTNPSSESLSHFSVYNSSKNTNFVIHIHNFELWNKMKNSFPTTDEKAEYGTPEMALEIGNLVEKIDKKENLSFSKAIVMGGHQDGILFFGNNLTLIYHSIIDLIKKFNIKIKKN